MLDTLNGASPYRVKRQNGTATRRPASFSFPLPRLVALCCLGALAFPEVMAAPPDLTKGTPKFTPHTDRTTNLGPTGMRGWMHYVSGDTSQSRQILVTEVAAEVTMSDSRGLTEVLETVSVILFDNEG